MNLFALATLFAALGFHCHAQQLTVTHSTGANGCGGFMFDVEANQMSDVTINEILFNFNTGEWHQGEGANKWPTYGLWYKEGSFVGHNADESAWTLASSGRPLIRPGWYSTNSHSSFTIPAGQTYGVYIHGISQNLVAQTRGIPGFGHLSSASISFSDVVASDEHIKVYTGMGFWSSCRPFGQECGNDFYVTPTVKLNYKAVPVGCSIDVLSVDHSFGPSVVGKYFNFDKSELDMILGRTDWSNERLGTDKGTVVVWRYPNGGSVGDAHGRYDPYDSAKAHDWAVGDKITFSDCVKQN